MNEWQTQNTMSTTHPRNKIHPQAQYNTDKDLAKVIRLRGGGRGGGGTEDSKIMGSTAEWRSSRLGGFLLEK